MRMAEITHPCIRKFLTETFSMDKYNNILPNKERWFDTSGKLINAHAGGIMKHGGVYYWYGEHKTEGWEGRLAFFGVHGYSSTDLVHWDDLGIVLRVSHDPASPICAGCRIERPKVIYCPSTGKFVMYFHSTDANHKIAKRGLAVASAPEGPFQFLDARRANAGHFPVNAPEHDSAGIPLESELGTGEDPKICQYPIYARDVANGQMCRDMNLFVDDDGSAWHLYSSEHNSTLHLARLTDDYLDWTGEWYRILPYRWNEGAALFKRNGWYFLMMSGCTGWDPNAARGAVARDLRGPWSEFGNPAKGEQAEITFGTQSSAVFSICDRYFVMLDFWNPENFIDSRYSWLELKFPKEDRFEVEETAFFASPLEHNRKEEYCQK